MDGSNIATEGRSTPSLAQLDAAIRAFLEEYPELTTGDVTVVVDATFGHRIDPSERAEFDQAVAHGEIIAPPAGAVGRGDGFILRIAEKSDAIVLSNDSFQEFHGERPWLFDSGRLIGGKPVPGVGWVFTPRTPVRGPRSRSATRRSGSDGAAVDEGETTRAAAGPRGRRRRAGGPVDRDTVEVPEAGNGVARRAATTSTRRAAGTSTGATGKTGKSAGATGKEGKAAATNAVKAGRPAKAPKPAMAAAKATKPAKATRAASAAKPASAAKATKAAKGTKARPSSAAAAAGKASSDRPAAKKRAKREASSARSTTAAKGAPAAARAGDGATGNDPLTFLNFVAEHPIGSTLEGTVVAFTSHGAYVDVEGMQAHVPLRGLGSPPPQRARHVLGKGERRRFVLVSLDAPRRRAELALADQGGPKEAAEAGR